MTDEEQVEVSNKPAMKDLIVGVTAVVTPTIMQCGQGGFIVVMPNVGIRAVSSFEEALDVVSQYSRETFRGPEVDSPRVLRKVWEQAKTRVKERAEEVTSTDVAKGMVAVGFMGLVSAVLIAMGLIGS